jgi:flagellar biosynthesis/type III secretory pathway protein FliH
MTMDVKKFFADLFAIRKPTEPPPPASVVDVDAAHEAGRKVGYEAGHAEGYEAGRKAGYEDGHAEGYEAGYKKSYDEGFQIALEAKTPQESPRPPEQPSPPEPAGGGTAIE